MKTHFNNRYLLPLLLVGLGLFYPVKGAVTFSTTPAAVSNTYTGTITLQIGGLTNNETVVVQKFLDLNTNGVVDGGDWLVQQFTLKDGTNFVIGGVNNFNVPGDTDGTANGQITASLNFQNGDFAQDIVGKYLYKLSSPAGHFTPVTNSFNVTNFPFAQTITGNVYSNGTSATVPNAIVLLYPPGARAPSLAATVANNVGNYTISAPPGTYSAVAFKSNYIAYSKGAAPVITLPGGQTIITNLVTTNATASISGNLADASTGMVLPGVMVKAQQSGSGLMSVAFTDTNGAFSVPVTPGVWNIKPDKDALSFHGYGDLGSANQTNVNAGMTGVTVGVQKATALIYGNVKDSLGNPMTGLDVEGMGDNSLFDTGVWTDANGNYVLGVLGLGASSSWTVVPNDDSQLTTYVFSGQTISGNINEGQAVVQNFIASVTNFAPTSISGETVIFNTTQPHVATIPTMFSGLNFTDLGTNTSYGIYAWSKVDGNDGQLTQTNMEPDSDYGDITTLMLTYTNVYSGTVTGVVVFAGGGSKTISGTFTTSTLSPLMVTTTTLPNGTNGVAYSQILTASGGQMPYTWTNSSDTLPPGLTLAANGVISGTPTNSETFNFTVKVTDATNSMATQELELTVITPSPTFTVITNNGSITITAYIGPGGAVVIPPAIYGYPVTGIGDYAFSNCFSLTSVTLGTNVTSIGEGAFCYCTSLTSITIPNNVTNIGNEAFIACTSLTSITIPNSVTSIGSYAFQQCTSLTNAAIQGGTIGNQAFYGCTSLSRVTLGNNVTSIGDFAFWLCTNLTSAAIQGGAIGDDAFEDCYNLTNVTLGTSVTSIGDYAFWDCASLTSIIIPDSVSSIGEYAFSGSYYNGASYNKGDPLASITILSSVISIGDYAFEYCTNLTSAAIQGGTIGNQAFYGCTSLASVTLGTNVTSDYAFEYCTSLTNATIQGGAIGKYAFYGCNRLTSLTLGTSVTSIGNYAFWDCEYLTSITIPNSVTNIGDYAFIYCTLLRSVTIPNSVTSIGTDAFAGTSLTSVTIQGGTIGDYAFSGCTSLTNVTLGNNVTSIGDYAFSSCYRLPRVYFQGNAPTVNGQPGSVDSTVFSGESGMAYYLPGTTGWGVTFGGWRTAGWYQPQPTILGNGYGLGVRSNSFGFNISWATNISVVVQASTNLANPVWTPLATNPLVSGTNYFSDSKWTNYHSRFYRVRSP